MKTFSALVLFFVIGFSTNTYGQTRGGPSPGKPKLQIETRLGYENLMNHLGESPLGRSQNLFSRLRLSKGHETFFDLEYDSYFHNKNATNHLPLDKSKLSTGLNIPVSTEIRLSGVINQSLIDERSKTGKNFFAYGLYIAKENHKSYFKLGYEGDSQGAKLYYGASGHRIKQNWFLSYGASLSNTPGFNEIRLGAANGYTFSKLWNNTAMLGIAENFETKKASAVYGISRGLSSRQNQAWEPNYIFLFRDKPESDYFLGLLTLKGTSLSQRVNEQIFRSLFEGTLSKTRIVNNRDFNVLGVGSGYYPQDYGKIVFHASLGRSRITDYLERRFNEEGIFYTFEKTGATNMFFLGLIHFGADDIIYNRTNKKLEGIYSHGLKLSAGNRLKIFDRPVRIIVEPNINLKSAKRGITVSLSLYF